MGQNLALNIAEKGFPLSIYNRITFKVDETIDRAHQENNLPLLERLHPRDLNDSIISTLNSTLASQKYIKHKAIEELQLIASIG
ncbi:hypothetical protein UlMin_029052 [Ulmus minor]